LANIAYFPEKASKGGDGKHLVGSIRHLRLPQGGQKKDQPSKARPHGVSLSISKHTCTLVFPAALPSYPAAGRLFLLATWVVPFFHPAKNDMPACSKIPA
jgi:hypothetical protein